MPVSQGFDYSENDAYLAFKYLSGITYVALRVVAGLFNRHLGENGQDIKDLEALTDLMGVLPQRYQALPALMDKVIEKIQESNK